MSSIASRIQDQIARAERRWQRSTQDRRRAHAEIDGMAHGEAPDWRALDGKMRYARRLERLGMRQAAEALVEEDAADFNPLERILGASQLTGVEFFERGLVASRAVCRIEIRGAGGRLSGYGSGVMVSPRLLLTNNHVLASVDDAAASVVQFDYLTTGAGIALEPRAFRLQPGVFFATDARLDFTLVAVEPVNAVGDPVVDRGWAPLIPGSGKAVVGERVNIIQHPNGERMQIAIRENLVVAVVDDFMQYEADTRPGSSGSPVFNEQWEMAALHHAGVPKRDGAGDILMTNGQRWTGRREDIDRIAWIANEGVRISRIVSHVNDLELSSTQEALWQAAFVPPEPPNIWDLAPCPTVPPSPGPVTEAVGPDGTASWLFRVSFGPVGAAPPAVMPPHVVDTVPQPVPAPGGPPVADPARDLAERILERFHQGGPYYDEGDDALARQGYWQDVDLGLASGPLAIALRTKLEATHTGRHSYARARHEFLYPAIDLRPDGSLQNVYSGQRLDPLEVIARELDEVLARAEAQGFETDGIDLDRLLDSDDLWQSVEAETLGDETASAFNCEHVVCQSWFHERQPMKADIHHLFTCEPGCNSFRSNIPYWQFGPEDEAVRDLCGRREGNKFEPEFGHGAAARATMYFLMRYPGEVGDVKTELTKSRVGVLMDWHEAHPPCLWEKHRNWLTERAQGNRNPFIDFPDIATAALLEQGFG